MSQKRLWQDEGLAFFSRITASFSHEINNVITIIDELSGLMDDLLGLAEEGMAVDHGKLKSIAANISRQVDRGEEMIKRLNRFAHSVDDPVKSFDLVSLLRDMTGLSQRFVAMRRVNLVTSLPEEPLIVVNSPFYLQHALFLSIQMALMGLERDDTITLTCETCPEGARITVASSRQASPSKGDRDCLARLVAELGGTALEGRKDFVLDLPLSLDKPFG